jgi:hypothetical protein
LPAALGKVRLPKNFRRKESQGNNQPLAPTLSVCQEHHLGQALSAQVLFCITNPLSVDLNSCESISEIPLIVSFSPYRIKQIADLVLLITP